MTRDLVAMIVTVEVDIERWETFFSEQYDADRVLDYVEDKVASSVASGVGALKDIRIRFRRQPIEGKS